MRLKISKFLIFIILIIFIVAFGKFDDIEPHHTPVKPYDVNTVAKAEAQWEANAKEDFVIMAKRYALKSMKDETSTIFQDLKVVDAFGSRMVCGYYDSKNSFGAYSGKKRFITDLKTILFEGRDPALPQAWERFCEYR